MMVERACREEKANIDVRGSFKTGLTVLVPVEGGTWGGRRGLGGKMQLQTLAFAGRRDFRSRRWSGVWPVLVA